MILLFDDSAMQCPCVYTCLVFIICCTEENINFPIYSMLDMMLAFHWLHQPDIHFCNKCYNTTTDSENPLEFNWLRLLGMHCCLACLMLLWQGSRVSDQYSEGLGIVSVIFLTYSTRLLGFISLCSPMCRLYLLTTNYC